MTLAFTKMNGAGNDFVVVDNRDGSLTSSLTTAAIARLCSRQRGVGADGFLAVELGRGEAPHRMRYYNADGGEAEMCGNGARCFARFLAGLLGPEAPGFLPFETLAGVIVARFVGDEVEIRMSDPHDQRLNLELELEGRPATIHHWNTGVPHAMEVVDDLEAVDIRPRGAALRWHSAFQPAGANANFQQVLRPGSIAIRTFERGVEDETLACGTGVVANALLHAQLTGAASPVAVRVAGGETLQVSWDREGEDFVNVRLQGPAVTTFTGVIEL